MHLAVAFCSTSAYVKLPVSRITATKCAQRREPNRIPPRACHTRDTDNMHMQRCVELALRAAGQTRPNPIVGCVLVGADGTVLSEGYHARAGLPHAEAVALASARAADLSTTGCTAFVSLEPCAHFGRTPPCANALVAAGVSRVVVGIADPDPRVSGRGFDLLRAAGITVDIGVESVACEVANEGFLSRVRKNRPFGTLKYAMTMDGKLATETGSSRWVTGPAARARVHHMRGAADAIVVGGRTLRKDDPRLTVRDGRGKREGVAPYRVVMTRTMDVDVDARLWMAASEDENAGEVVVLADMRHGRPHIVSELRAKGVIVEEVPGLRPKDAMAFLYQMDCLTVLWECGGALAREAIVDGSVQKVCAFIAPKIVGGVQAPSPVDGNGICLDMGDAVQLERTNIEVLDGGDVLFEGYLREKEQSVG